MRNINFEYMLVIAQAIITFWHGNYYNSSRKVVIESDSEYKEVKKTGFGSLQARKVGEICSVLHHNYMRYLGLTIAMLSVHVAVAFTISKDSSLVFSATVFIVYALLRFILSSVNIFLKTHEIQNDMSKYLTNGGKR